MHLGPLPERLGGIEWSMTAASNGARAGATVAARTSNPTPILSAVEAAESPG